MSTEPPSGAAAAVLRTVDQVVADLHRRHPPAPASLHSRLERDLGLDSLALAEVLVCLEDTFGVSLPSSILATAETPDDLLRAVGEAGPRTARWSLPDVGVTPSPVLDVPVDTETLLDVLDWHCATHPDRVHLRLLGASGPEAVLTYADLRRGASAVARGLIGDDLSPGESVALMLPTGRSYFEAFVGVLLAGGVPVPIYPPSRPSQIEDHLRRHAGLLSNARVALLLTVPEARAAGRLLRSSVESMRRVTSVDELADHGDRDVDGERFARIEPGATALIQYTSGSTGQPKGVVLSHAKLLANIRAMGQAAEVTPNDVFVSWLPLYHDMGLIGAWLGSLCLNMPAVIMSPLTFLARPVRWLEASDAGGGTLTGAPNFAYELCLRKITDAEIETLDLSSLRMALNGAEPVTADTMERFADRFARCGLRPEALAPVYGLAECAVGLAFPPPGRGLLVDTVLADALQRDGLATPSGAGEGPTARIVACGQPLPGYEIRVVDRSGREVGDRTEGRIEFRGPSATSGYFRNPEATAALFDDGWLETGDLGYVAQGDLYLTGRSKDLIIRAGRNLHPEELETALGEVPGVRKGCVAAFATRDRGAATDRLVVVAETHESAEETKNRIRSHIVATTIDLLGTPPDDVVLAPPGTVLKTSSGKIRRAACADLYLHGAIGAQPRSAWWQLIRFGWSGIRPQLRRRRRWVASLSYALYCWALLAIVGLPAIVLLAVVPGEVPRRRLVRVAARNLLSLSGTPLGVHGEERLRTTEPCVVVANHGSWLDAVVLAAWLPPRFTFVAGEVFRRQHLAGFVMKRIGTEFVERSEPGQGVADTARLARVATERSLVIFPEGGLSRAPGLRPFHMGAFVAAVEADRPVVPVAIRGTRSMLRSGHRFMRRGGVTLVVGDPIAPTGEGWTGAVALCGQARDILLRHCGEPDLG